MFRVQVWDELDGLDAAVVAQVEPLFAVTLQILKLDALVEALVLQVAIVLLQPVFLLLLLLRSLLEPGGPFVARRVLLAFRSVQPSLNVALAGFVFNA